MNCWQKKKYLVKSNFLPTISPDPDIYKPEHFFLKNNLKRVISTWIDREKK